MIDRKDELLADIEEIDVVINKSAEQIQNEDKKDHLLYTWRAFRNKLKSRLRLSSS